EMGRLVLSADAMFSGLTIDGKSFDLRPFASTEDSQATIELPITYFGLGNEKFDLVVELVSDGDLTLHMSEYQGGWPQGLSVPQRAENIAPLAWSYSDSAIITHSSKF
ncbi:MAG: hypothetical protein KJO88_03565, partial [Gammaproteobacteria bacterium]|nr:hypothetical protein [Gammaproteobacteria bacterium]